MINFDFAPNIERAQLLDARMHGELADSLDYVVQQAAEALEIDPAASAPLIAALSSGVRYAPTVFADYYDLVEAIENQGFEEARALYARLSGARPAPDRLQIQALGAPDLQESSERFKRMMNEDQSIDLGFSFPAAEAAEAFAARLERGWAMLDAALPALSGEIRSIIRQVVIAGSDPTKKYQFDGGSHYRLWGALFLNCQYHTDEIAVCEVLAHESAHSLLFGFCTQEALVENDDDDLYASPLRVDLRPMDGIYHATFVSARMHWAMTGLAASGVLNAEQKDRALAAAAADLLNFDAGYGVVAEHGMLTHTGRSLMDGAHAYMTSAR